VAITRADLLKELLPGLNALFDIEYAKSEEERLKEKTLRVQGELMQANPTLQPEELDALTKLTLRADTLKEKQHE
jgi:hypothetical protein